MKLGELALTYQTGIDSTPLTAILRRLACPNRGLVLLAFQSRRHPPSSYRYTLPALAPTFTHPILKRRFYHTTRII